MLKVLIFQNNYLANTVKTNALKFLSFSVEVGRNVYSNPVIFRHDGIADVFGSC